MYDYHELQTEALWVQTLLNLDSLYDAVRVADAGFSATELNTISGSLVSLRQSGLLSTTSLEELDSLQSIFADAITRETLGFRNAFDGIFDPEYGDIGRVVEVPILSENGKRAKMLMQDLLSIRAKREALRARIDTELQMARLLAA